MYGYFAKWQQDGVFEQFTGLLRRLVREAEGRDAEPSACVLDSQTIKTSANVPRAEQGTDAGKRIIGASATSAAPPSACCCLCWSPPPTSPTPQPA